MMDLVQIMDSDTKKTAKVAKLKEWFVAREAQMAQLSLDGKFLHYVQGRRNVKYIGGDKCIAKL